MSEFLWAVLGAGFPELTRQYNLRQQQLSFPKSYYVVTLLFLIGSGFVALALPGTLTPIAAIYAGFSAPVIVSVGADNLADIRRARQDASDKKAGGAQVDDIQARTKSGEYVRLGGNRFLPKNGFGRFLSSLGNSR